MASYRVFGNDGAGGPIDYNTVLHDTSGLLYATAPLAAPGVHRFGVRAYDPVSGLEEKNTDAAVRIEIDASGDDVSARPGPISHLAARPGPNGSVVVEWTYLRPPGRPDPAGFKLWITAGTSVNYLASPALTVGSRGSRSYRATLPGPYAGPTYAVGVRAYAGALDDGGTLAAIVEPDSSAPDAPDDLSARVT
jgi:hypothetical protein